jgi:hypothetical protein
VRFPGSSFNGVVVESGRTTGVNRISSWSRIWCVCIPGHVRASIRSLVRSFWASEMPAGGKGWVIADRMLTNL